MSKAILCPQGYTHKAFVQAAAQQLKLGKVKRGWAEWTVSKLEDWSRHTPRELYCLSAERRLTTTEFEAAVVAATVHIEREWSKSAAVIIGWVLWWIALQIIKAIIILWITELFFNDTTYPEVMGG